MKPLGMSVRMVLSSSLLLILLCAQPVSSSDPSPVWGVLHSIHTTNSDGTESPAQRPVNLRAYYDWSATSDHDVQVSGTEWTNMKNEASANNTDGVFTYFAAYEWKGTASNNSEVLVFFEGDGPGTKVNGSQADYNTFSELVSWLEANDGMGCINHPARSANAVDWGSASINNETYLPCVEMLNKDYFHWNEYWNCSEGSGCTTYGNPSPDSSMKYYGGVKNALDGGYRYGFVAGWDYHGAYVGVPGAYTGLVNPSNWSRSGVFDTIRRRHTWAAQDKILMSVSASNGSDTLLMGDAAGSIIRDMSVNYTLEGASGHNIENVSFFFDGVIVNFTRYSGRQNVSGVFNANIDEDSNYLFVEAVQDDGARAWSSPIYVSYTDVPPEVSLVAPAEAEASGPQVTFECAAEDNAGLSNLTLYGNWSGGWHANETVALSGLTNSSTFTKGLDAGVYMWDCLAYDDGGLSAWSVVNRTVTARSVSREGGHEPFQRPITFTAPLRAPNFGEPFTLTVRQDEYTRSGAQVMGADVGVYIDGRLVYSGRTDYLGQFTFTPDEPGDYLVSMTKNRFSTEYSFTLAASSPPTTTTVQYHQMVSDTGTTSTIPHTQTSMTVTLTSSTSTSATSSTLPDNMHSGASPSTSITLQANKTVLADKSLLQRLMDFLSAIFHL